MIHAQVSKADILCVEELALVRSAEHLHPPLLRGADAATQNISGIRHDAKKPADPRISLLMLQYCIVAPFGTLISAMAFGEITVLYQRLNLLEGQHSDDMAFSAEAMRILRVPQEMQKRVDQYFRQAGGAAGEP